MSKKLFWFKRHSLLGLLMLSLSGLMAPVAQAAVEISQTPLFLSGSTTPLVLMVMGRDHKLYYEAYNDASDLNNDGVLDITYKPNEIEYFGLFDSYLCYTYGSGKFSPAGTTMTKKCSGQWSGDFLNYLTTSRMDAMRKVFYGGNRASGGDTSTGTVLERSFIPQDAHSWGKEYQSEARDGYKINEYAPLQTPVNGTYHLFANTTILGGDGKPLLRVLNDTQYRVWEWVSIERPVAGTKCKHGKSGPNCETSGGTTWNIVPGLSLTQTVYKIPTSFSHPSNSSQFDSLVTSHAIPANLCGSQAVSSVNGSGNPFNGTNGCTNDNYLNLFTGTITITVPGTYKFSVDGDDAIDLKINGTSVAGYYGGHGSCNCNTNNGSIYLPAGTHSLLFRHEEASGGDSYYLRWELTVPDSKITDHIVHVDACVTGYLQKDKPSASEYCKGYPSDNPSVWKPAGILQQYGEYEPELMAFGLLTGSYTNNLEGGVMRKDIGPFSKTSDAGNEINRNDGTFNTSVNGIVQTLSKLQVTGFAGDHEYTACGGSKIGARAITNGECRMWGNPIGEMMYEGLRYFSGKTSPTADFIYSDTNDDGLTLPKLSTWKNLFRAKAEGGYKDSGTKCIMLTISDINPSYDTNKIPGTAFPGGLSDDLGGFNAATLAKTISDHEAVSNPAFIGESLDHTPNTDNAPTPKTVTSLGRIRGMAPEEPTKLGGFYSASAAYFGNRYGIGGVEGRQRVETMSVAVASPLPRFEIPVDGKTIVLVPFAKSIGGSFGFTTTGFQATNQIVDFYVEAITNTGPGNQDPTDNGGRPHGIFRINYEDVEQGNDHDMDAIVRYEFWVQADNTLKIKLDSIYAAGSVEHHLGYVISGTDGQDGIYLEVRDQDTSAGNDDDYILDTPVQTTTETGLDGGMTLKRADWPTDHWKHKATSGALPLTATRLFRVSPTVGTAAGYIAHDPLWYAAKWGGFSIEDKVAANKYLPDKAAEWDSDGDGVPDNYFLVTNAGKLKDQLSKAFQAILSKRGSSSVLAVESGQGYGGGCLYQARFNSENWTGQVLAIKPTSKATGKLDAEKCNDVWIDAGEELDEITPSTRTIITRNPEAGFVDFQWGNLSTAQKDALSPEVLPATDPPTYNHTEGEKRFNFLRGVTTNEGDAAGQYRKRDTSGSQQVETPTAPEFKTTGSVLGDIVNSGPLYVSYPSLRYRDDLETPTHASFRNAKSGRPGMIYVGSNDGMLHGFSAADGKEKIAYVPSTAYSSLERLTRQNYKTTEGCGVTETCSQHRYFVDASPYMGDAFWGGAWNTVLIGRLGAGGQGLFALDITNPVSFSTGNLLWEFTDAQDADLGYTYGKSVIAKTKTGQWAAIFGNGYNSAATTDVNGNADTAIGTRIGALFIVDVEDGTVIAKISTGVTSDGLSTPYLYDVDGDNIVDWIYAGDVEGRLWKFDVSDPSPTNWVKRLLFTAATGQSITSSPITIENPNGGVMVLFGTGRYLGESDKTNVTQQTYYAIWDQEYWGSDNKKDTSDGNVVFSLVSGISLLRQQAFTGSQTVGDKTYRTSSASNVCWEEAGCTFKEDTDSDGVPDTDITYNQHRGWYINLPYAYQEGEGSERVYTDSELNDGRIVFVSNAPTEGKIIPDPCETAVGSGKSWLNMLDALTGKRLDESFRKVDEQGKVTPIEVIDPVTGEKIAPTSLEGEGLSPGQKTITDPTTDTDYIAFCQNDGSCDVIGIPASSGRMSWRQLQFP